VFQLHFPVTIATQLSPWYSRDAFSKALIHDVTSGLNGLAYISHTIHPKIYEQNKNLKGTSHLRDKAVGEESILDILEVDVYDLF
jgi:hypothetical protein